MIIVTGASGFIGSRLIARLNRDNFKAIVAVDHFADPKKESNFEDLALIDKVERTNLFPWIRKNYREIEFIFHIGARTDTTEFNRELLFDLNTRYSMEVWKYCVEFQ